MLDGQADVPQMDGSGELAPWVYTWAGLERFSLWKGSEFGTANEQGNPVIPPAVEYVYSFEEVLPVPGYTAEYALGGWTVANTRLARVGDYVWYDNNHNGIQDAGEPGVPEVRVTISGNQLPEGYAATQLTDENGHYLFGGLPPGEYTISFDEGTLPAGYAITQSMSPGSTAENDSNGLVSTVILTTEDDLTIDLGIVKRQPPPPSYDAISVPMKAEKSLAGRQLREGDFTFILRDGAGNVIEETTNKADGSILFTSRRFSRTGRFIYTIEEKAGNSADIIYDRTVYRAIVDVSASGNTLHAKLSIERNGTPYAGAIRFQNEARLPATGDSALWLPLLLIITAAAMGVGAVILKHRRRE